MTFADLNVIGPLVAAIGTAIAILIVDLVWPGRATAAIFVALAGLGITAAATLGAGTIGATTAFGGMYRLDALTTFLDLLFISIVAMTIVFAPDYLAPRNLPVAEFAVVLVFAMCGAMVIAASADLLLLFLGLELMVLPGYLLAGYHKSDSYSTEGAVKYFLLGSFSSAIFLFGLAFVWGLSGSTNIAAVATTLTQVATGQAPFSPGLAMGLAFLTTGVAFKIAAVPFHYWTPDAYQGSPTPVTGYLSVGPKIGAFALILRLFVEALGPMKADWLPVVIILAATTMTLGNLVALTQDNVKRMLAYSSIAHTGYMLVGLAAYAGGQASGLEALLFYGAAYSFMNLGAFAVIAALQKRAGRDVEPEHVRRSHPARAGADDPDVPVPAVVDRDPADRRVLRQAPAHPVCGRGRRLGRRAGDLACPERRGGRVLLPAGRRLHVHARAGQRRADAPPRAAALERPRCRDRPHDRIRRVPGPDPRHGRAGSRSAHRRLTRTNQGG